MGSIRSHRIDAVTPVDSPRRPSQRRRRLLFSQDLLRLSFQDLLRPIAGPRMTRWPQAVFPVPRYALSQRGRVTSSTSVKVTRTGSPISMVAGSISLIGPPARCEQVADEADRRLLLERDDDHVVGRELCVGREQRRVGDRERPDRPAPTRRDPVVVERPAVRAHRARGHAPPAAARTGLDEQLTARGPGPERRGRLVVEIGQQPGRVGGHRRNSTALVGTPSPLVTRQDSAPSTWAVEVPRHWRTPSSTRLKPWT